MYYIPSSDTSSFLLFPTGKKRPYKKPGNTLSGFFARCDPLITVRNRLMKQNTITCPKGKHCSKATRNRMTPFCYRLNAFRLHIAMYAVRRLIEAWGHVECAPELLGAQHMFGGSGGQNAAVQKQNDVIGIVQD